MAAHAVPEDVRAELEVLEAAARAARAERDLWALGRRLVDSRRITVEHLATLTGVSTRTAHRRLGRSRAGAAGHV